MDYLEAKNCLIEAKIDDCKPFFKNNGYLLEEGYCEMLEGKYNDARRTFTIIRDKDMRADWAYLLIQFIKNYIQFFPSYLQIRNFLEIDIALLLKAGLIDAVENIVNAADIFYEINQESYKFISRVMLNYNFPTIAKIYLNKAYEKCYNDPEMHFIYGNYHLLFNNDQLAKHEFETSLEVLPNYYPAQMMLDRLNNK